MSQQKNVVGMNEGRFNDCPSSPNCVSSMAKDELHMISAIDRSGVSKERARTILLEILADEERCRIVSQTDDYIHAEFRTKLWRFVDDVEFYLPAEEEVVHVKSASRVGVGDLGVNRKRVMDLAGKFEQRARTGTSGD